MTAVLFDADAARRLLEREQPWAMPVIKSVTLDVSLMTGVHDSHLIFNYDGKRVRYQVIHADYNQDQTQVTLRLRLDRVLNESDPE